MDVTCERCGTEYEFDETLLSGRGTSVKCTNCGHVFKVYPKAALDADRTTSTWRLRLGDGSVDTIDSLRELQRRIAAGELTPQNDIARGDDDWKKLGSIPELGAFFQAAGVQIASSSMPSTALPSSEPPVWGTKESTLPPGRRPRQRTLLGHAPIPNTKPGLVHTGEEEQAEAEAEEAFAPEQEAEPEQGAAAEPEAASEGDAAHHAPDEKPGAAPLADPIEDAEFEERPTGSTRPSTPPPSYYDDDEDIPDLSVKTWSPLRWLLLIVIVGSLALFATQWERVAGLFGIGSDPALIAAAVEEGDAALAQGHPQAYASAIEAYGRAAAAGGNRSPEVLAKLSNAYALEAQAKIDDGVDADQVESLEASALSNAQRASALDPRDLDAKLAEADALRLSGNLETARTLLEEARAFPFSRTAEFFRVDARLSAAEAGGGLENGLRSAKQAADLSPAGTRYLLLLARAERAAGNEDRARTPLRAILGESPEHPVAGKLLQELDEAAADAAAEAAPEPDPAPAPEPAPEPASEPAPAVAPKPKAARRPPKQRASAPKPTRPRKPAYDEYDRLASAAGDDAFVDGRPPVRDYEWYMEQGRAELAAGNHVRARAFFDSALEARPGSAEAMDGLGRVATAIGDHREALRYFRVAAQRGHPDGYFNLGRAYERRGQNEKAVSAYYTYLKRRPTGTYASAARSAIKTLEPRAKLPPELEPEPAPRPGSQPDLAGQPESAPVEQSAQELEPSKP